METSIDLINVTKKYHKRKVLDNITLKFTFGKAYMLVGENGSGKSTILKLITGLIFPTSGVIKKSNLKISYVPEKVMLPRFVKTIDFLNILREIKESSLDKMNELITYFDLDIVKEKKIKELSKGMMQKVLLIQALMDDSSVFIFDEVLNGLDKVSQSKLLEYIKDNKHNKLFIISSHYSDYYLGIVDEIIDLNKVKENAKSF